MKQSAIDKHIIEELRVMFAALDMPFPQHVLLALFSRSVTKLPPALLPQHCYLSQKFRIQILSEQLEKRKKCLLVHIFVCTQVFIIQPVAAG